MAPVPFQHPVKYAPLAKTASYIALIVYLTYAVTASFYASYKALRPAQDTRSRQAQRKRLAPAFFGLAIAAFSLAAYSSIATAILSYKTWAYEHGLDQPERLMGGEGLVTNSTNSSLQYITQWLSDTPIYYDALEIVADKARRFWWGQQIDLATVGFSMLLAIEGRRRNIPLLSAFLALAHLVNLSYAQNLFYLALLLTPAPLPTGDELELPITPIPTSTWTRVRDWLMPPKPKNWHLNPLVLLATLALNYGSIFVLPYAANTPSFMNVVLVARASTFLPLILPKIVPISWGTVHSHPHDAYSSYTTLFRTISVVSFVLHLKATFVGLAYNTPSAHFHRHSVFLPWDTEERTTWERSTTAVEKLLGSIFEHPVITAVGGDGLISALGLSLWAAVRATDVHDIIQSAVPFYNPRLGHEKHTTEDEGPRTSVKAEPEPTEDGASEHYSTALRRRRGRPAKYRGASIASSTDASEDLVEASATPTPGRRRGRPRKITRQPPEEERPYEPPRPEAEETDEGDVLPPGELDWEAAALAFFLAEVGGLGVACAGVYGGECVAR
ncbi:hypothetical protein F4779DRAFT_578452 [Xylariaceae sp. FL0662B]|nr:hypothetical protein F4779DRAFT_578452 [Xylariaceae sp. FL0662B]